MKTEEDQFTINRIMGSARNEFTRDVLEEGVLENDPFKQFDNWLQFAFKGDLLANAMVLSTVDRAGLPDSRVVLLRNISYGGFTFYSNYESKKAKDIKDNPHGSLLFFWKEYQRQIKIQGTIGFVPKNESDDYFQSRPFESKVGAWASKQSAVVEDRKALDRLFEIQRERFPDGNVPRPDNWGGYVLQPTVFEFWQGRCSRLHDRMRYRLNEQGTWVIERLMP
jgi:pyridoxamine 5'-phosphate oxidase